MRTRLLSFLAALLAIAASLEAQPSSGDPGGGLLGVPLGTFYEGEYVGDIVALQDGRVLVSTEQTVEAFSVDGAPLGAFGSTLIIASPLAQLPDGRVLFITGPGIRAFDPDGTPLDVFADIPPPSDAIRDGIRDAVGLADGRVLILQWYQEEDGDEAGRLFAFASDGTLIGPFTADETDAYLFYPEAVKQLADGRVIVAEARNPIFPGPIPRGVTAFDAATGERLVPLFEGSVQGDLAVLPDGRVLGDNLSGDAVPPEDRSVSVKMLAPDGTYLGPFADVAGDLFASNRIAVHPDGRVLVTEPSTGRVLAFGVVPVSSEPESPEASGVGAVFPQPLARGTEANVEVTPEAPGVVTIRVYDAVGRLVAEAWPLAVAGRQRLSVPVSGLGAGVYVVRVEGAGLAASRRLVVAE